MRSGFLDVSLSPIPSFATPGQNLENQSNVFRTCCFLYILKLKKSLFVNWGKTGGAKVQPTHLDLGNRVRAIAAPGKYSRDLTRLPPTHVNEDVARHTQSVPILKHVPHDISVRQLWKPSFYLSACHATAGGGGALGPMSCRGLLPPKTRKSQKHTVSDGSNCSPGLPGQSRPRTIG